LIWLVVVVVNNRNASSTPLPPGVPTRADRTASLRSRQDRYREERARILGMVEQGRVSPEEADRLFESLERETSTSSCPFCGGEIRAEAVKCKHCRKFLAEEMYRPKRLTKSHDKVLAGVCGGVADYFGLDRSLVRVLVALVVFFSSILPGLIVYLVAALILPEPE
jgi:phage shock protein PspC (stress-responsive transcriptional regulator)